MSKARSKEQSDLRYVTCSKCKWVHFAVTPDYVKKWAAEWVVYWKTLSVRDRESFGAIDGPPSVVEYLYCGFCGASHALSSDSQEGDVPFGSTVSPILAPEYNASECYG